ncbi:MAG: hypothetical protein QM767_15005 [Anaeromyxobacter sp.]
MRVVPLPPNPDLEKMLSGLVMRELKVKPAEGLPPDPVAIGLYRTEEPVQEVALLVELPLAASLAAALSVVPPGAVKDAVAAQGLEPSLQQNLAEVMNVLARFVSMSGRRFGLAATWFPPGELDPKVLAAARESDETRVVAVEVPGYMPGRLAFNTL